MLIFIILPFDVDGDGDMDILANSQTTNAYTLFENRNGAYVKNKRIERPFANTSTVILDVNNDGRKDIVYLANNSLNWFQNLGVPIFQHQNRWA
ncbi:MAG: VCBS repeat-containing protein [Saprospiraceae bacterium]|nr:VCBS repeat-containing protein [Saprospiraceae bacterium]